MIPLFICVDGGPQEILRAPRLFRKSSYFPGSTGAAVFS